MARKFIDCRDFPESHCSVALSADNDEELLDAAVEHGCKMHGHQDTPEFREELRKITKEGSPPA
jgi:hypothetical protein